MTRQQQPRLYNLLENLCISRGIPMPKLKIMDSEALNAFATGLNQRQYAVTVTTGLLNALNDQEIEAVLGHELTHIRNGDVQMMVIAVIIAGVVGFFAELFFRMLHQFRLLRRLWRRRLVVVVIVVVLLVDSDSKGSGGGAIVVIIIAVALIALAWLLSQVVRLALSRSRELLADAGSVELTKNPDAMISALRKIENRGELPGATSAVMELCVDNPREGFSDLFATHPSVDAAGAGAGANSPADTIPGRWRCRRMRPTAGRSAAGTGRRPGSAAVAVRPMERCQRTRPARRTGAVAGTLGQPRRPVGHVALGRPMRIVSRTGSGRESPPPALTTSAGLTLTAV